MLTKSTTIMRQSMKMYLELSEEGDGSHKFYQMTLTGLDLEINYGRIGAKGRVENKSFGSLDEAMSFIHKKEKKQLKKGYEHCIKGERAPRAIRAVARRPTYSGGSSSRSNHKKAPVISRFKTKRCAFGIFVDKDFIYIGDETGRVSVLDHDYQLHREHQLPAGTKCIVGDGSNVFAGTNQGHVYELTGKIARLAYDCPGENAILWMDLRDGVLAVSDDRGGLFAYDYEGDLLFQKNTGNGDAWMVRVDETSIYHGGNHVARYTFDGEQLWKNSTRGVLFGYQTESCVYPGGNGVTMIDKQNGKTVRKHEARFVPSNCTDLDGSRIFAVSGNNIIGWEKSGKEAFKLKSPNSGMSMQFFEDKLYIVGDSGLAVVDVSESATESALNDIRPEEKLFKASEKAISEVDSTSLVKAKSGHKGITLKCVQEGSKLKIKVESTGYDNEMNCQFPKNLRAEGRRYLVDKIELSANGQFYKVSGNIYTL